MRRGAVAVRDGAIAEVGTADAVIASHPGLEVRDLGDAILAPGFVDAHCHLEWSLLGGLLPPGDFAAWLGRLLPMRGLLTHADHLTAARHGALAALAAGTTTLSDSGPTGAGATALAEVGLRGLVHLEAFGREEGRAAREAAAAVADRVAALDEAVGPRGRAGVSPHAPYTVGPGLWAALREHPGLRLRPWATHLAESVHEAPAIAGRGGPLADLFAAGGLVPGRWGAPEDDRDGGGGGHGSVARVAAAGALTAGLVAAHCVQVGAAEVRLLAAHGVGVAHCPRSNAHLRCGRAPLAELRGSGAAVGLGTDSPASGGDYDLRAEARACRDAHAGAVVLDARTLLEMITRDGARAVGMDHAVGSLAPGKRADLVALAPRDGGGGADHDPAAACLDPASRVVEVVVDGEILLAGGAPTRADAHAVRARAAEVRGRLC